MQLYVYYQSASSIVLEISFQLRNKTGSLRSIFSIIVKDSPLVIKKGVEGFVYVVQVDQKAQQ